MTIDAVAFFAARLAFQTDVSDVQAALAGDDPGFMLVDTRDRVPGRQGHIPGAVHLPARRSRCAPTDCSTQTVPVVTYCWGPGCNGATRAALALAHRGIRGHRR